DHHDHRRDLRRVVRPHRRRVRPPPSHHRQHPGRAAPGRQPGRIRDPVGRQVHLLQPGAVRGAAPSRRHRADARRAVRGRARRRGWHSGALMISTDLATRITAHPQWYHTLDLGPGLQTPGWFDLRGVVDAAGMPASLAGKRCLDVATFDGFWAFEMEKRGAASVVGIDLIDPHLWDWPVSRPADAVEGIAARKGLGDGFLLAKEPLDSKVERRAMSVYDLNPSEVGMFDFVYVGSLLLHLRDPVRALE